MINTRITYKREYDNIPIEGVLVERFTHTNKVLRETKNICLIYYKDWIAKDTKSYFEDDDGDLVCESVLLERPMFRYVESSDARLMIYEGERSIYEAENKFELMNKYTPPIHFIKEYYVEDWLYNFVNYDGIKL